MGRKNLIVEIDPNLHIAFKKLCVEENKTIKDYVLELIRNELVKKGKANGENE